MKEVFIQYSKNAKAGCEYNMEYLALSFFVVWKRSFTAAHEGAYLENEMMHLHFSCMCFESLIKNVGMPS